MRRWILLALAAVCFPGLAHANPPRVILVAQDVPDAGTSPQNPALTRIIAQVVDEATCWQVAKLLTTASNQVFFCVSPPPADPSLKKVPPLTPKGKVV